MKLSLGWICDFVDLPGVKDPKASLDDRLKPLLRLAKN